MSTIGNALLTTYNLGHHPEDADFEWWEWYGQQPMKRIWRRAMETRLLSFCPSDSRSTLVLGCGSSPLTDQFPGRITALDINPWKIQFAESKLSNIRFVQKDIRDPVESLGKFDLIVASEILEHIPQDELRRVVSKFCSIVNPDGTFIVAAPSYDTQFGTFMENLLHDYHYKFSFTYLDTLFKEQGFKYVGTRNFFWDRVVSYRRCDAKE